MSRPLVLGLHGITGTGRSWDAVRQELGDDIELITPDLRGRGDAASLPGPWGIARHAEDALALIDRHGADRALVAGHSMGAYVAARLAADHPDRVSAVVLVDGGHPLPVPEGADPDRVLTLTLGPAIERLSIAFPDREAHREFWRAHPAFAGGQIEDEVLAAYADYDLGGEEPELRSRTEPDAVRADGRDLLADEETRTAIERVTAPGVFLRAPRGLQNEEAAFMSAEQAAAFAHDTIDLRQVADTNHYSILMGRAGARATADAIRELGAR